MRPSWEYVGVFQSPYSPKHLYSPVFLPSFFGSSIVCPNCYPLPHVATTIYSLVSVFNQLPLAGHFLALWEFWVRQDNCHILCQSSTAPPDRSKHIIIIVCEWGLSAFISTCTGTRKAGCYFQDYHWAGEWGMGPGYVTMPQSSLC